MRIFNIYFFLQKNCRLVYTVAETVIYKATASADIAMGRFTAVKPDLIFVMTLEWIGPVRLDHLYPNVLFCQLKHNCLVTSKCEVV